jgi:hypothetical protein
MNKKLYPTLLIPAGLLLFAASSANAETLVGGLAPQRLSIDETGTFKVSVFDNTFRVASVADGDPGAPSSAVDHTASDPLVDYIFVAPPGGSMSDRIFTDGGANRFSIGGFAGDKDHAYSLWETTDPENFTSTADFADIGGTRWTGTATNTIDISGLTSGSLYMIYGNNNTSQERGWGDITMSGTGPDLTLSNYGMVTSLTAAPGDMFVSSVSFTNEGDYDTISFTPTSYTFFSGMALTAVPEPSSFPLIAGFLGLTWVMLRRRS